MSKSKQEHSESKAITAAEKIFRNSEQVIKKMPCGKRNTCAEKKERDPGCNRGSFGPWVAGNPPPHHSDHHHWFGPPHHPHGHPMGGPGGCWGPPHHPRPWGPRHGCGRWGHGPPPQVRERLMKMWAEKTEELEGGTSSDDSGSEEASGPCMGGPPAHVMAHFMKMCSEDLRNEQNKDDKDGVRKAEKPNGTDEAGCPHPGMYWKQWMQMGRGPEVWFRVANLQNVNQEGAQVHVADHKLIVQGGRNDDSSSSDEEQLQHSIDLPKRIITRTLRTSWLGAHRLLMFALKKPKQNAEKEDATSAKQQDDVDCWFHSLQLPGFHQAQINVNVVDGKVVLHAFKESHNEETGDSDRMEATRTIALPEDIRKRTLRWARMGPMRLCLFALRKKKEQEVTGDEEDKDNEHIEMKEDVEEAGKPLGEVEWVKLEASEFSTEVDVRGFQSEDLSVSRKKNAVIVNAKRREEDGERSLRKTILLPEDVHVKSIRCSLSGDLLKITAHRSLTPVDVDDVADTIASIKVDVNSR
ncbi:hypothetical protein CAPTEDRAFT_226531 [Capitella teleta]|uniref:SHSP domain-containing protein n=1 Tax=Capitella teleta TaxID=283909 RepID=R7UW04_CAPTE|nr:hypothetical protein CAPTEDRAFT_226531 [Capitella teleta]|eukprot:ELU10452.1 hypothetical protein CAPTEDRAFT_226531 [Capitella teleta]